MYIYMYIYILNHFAVHLKLTRCSPILQYEIKISINK